MESNIRKRSAINSFIEVFMFVDNAKIYSNIRFIDDVNG